jgi:hypothetical protein
MHQPSSKLKQDIVPVIERQLAPIVDQALELEIKVQEDMIPATELLSKLNKFNDRITEEKERITKPLNEALKVERSRWKPLETAYDGAINYLRDQMTTFQTRQVQLQKAKEAKIAESLASGKITLDKAVSKIEKVKVPEKEVATTAGLVQFRETQVLKIWDHTMIPREYMLPDEKAILTALKEGKKVEGCELELKMVPANYR